MKILDLWKQRPRPVGRLVEKLSQRGVKLVPIWHFAVAALVAIAGAASVFAPALLGLDEPLSIWILLISFAVAGTQVLIALGIRRGSASARRAAVISNILLVATASFIGFQIARWILLFTLMGDAFYAAFGGLSLMIAGIAWWVVALRLSKRIYEPESGVDPTNRQASALAFIRVLRIAGQAVTAIGFVVWFIQFNPLTIIGMGLVALVAPNPLAAFFVLIALASIVAIRALSAEPMSRHVRANQSEEEKLAGWLFVAPSLLGFLAFLAGPLLYSLVMSFFEWNGSSQMRFVGLDNYANTLGLSFATGSGALDAGFTKVAEIFGVTVGALDPLFWRSMYNIIIFLVTAVPLAVIPALILATLIELRLPGSKAFRAIFFIPSVAGVIGVTLIWKQMLNSSVGFFNYAIQEIFVFLNLLLPGDPLPTRVEIGWLSTEQWALAAVVVVFAWSQFGFNTVLFIAGLQSISKELYEAAELDGANSFQRFIHVTLPALRPTTFFVTATTVILALQLFDVVFALNQPNVVGFPNNATLTPVVYLYQLGFQQGDFGKASAVAWILFAVIFTFTLIQFNRQKKEAEAS